MRARVVGDVAATKREFLRLAFAGAALLRLGCDWTAAMHMTGMKRIITVRFGFVSILGRREPTSQV